jgi:hypothetical protein
MNETRTINEQNRRQWKDYLIYRTNNFNSYLSESLINMTRRVLGLWVEEMAAKYGRYVQYIEEVTNSRKWVVLQFAGWNED